MAGKSVTFALDAMPKPVSRKSSGGFSVQTCPIPGKKGGFLSTKIGGFHMGGARPGCFVRGSFLVMLFASLFGCSGPMLVTEYDDGMETGEETVIYDDKGHPEITSETGYVVDPYAEPDSVDTEDFRRNEPGVVPD
jgi:hypothetical protein